MNRLLLPVLFMAIVTFAVAQAPKTLSYQGTLSDSGGPLTGSHNLTFSIYDAASGGTTLWTETSSGVVVSAGSVSLTLGKLNPINIQTDRPLWMGIKVDSNPEASPRIELTGSLYALGLALPYVGTVTGSDIGLRITSTGTNSAGRFEVSNPGSFGNALFSTTNGGGIGIYGQSTGASNAGFFQVLNPANSVAALGASTDGTGNAFASATSGNGGSAGWFGTFNTSSAAPTVRSSTNGIGSAGDFSITNSSSTAPVLKLNHSGPGNAITANRPIQATQFIGDGSLLTNLPSSGGLTLPYSASQSNSSSLLSLNNSGSGAAITVSSDGNGPAFSATSNSASPSFAGMFQNTNASNVSPAIQASTVGDGSSGVRVIQGAASLGRGVDVFLQNPLSNADGIHVIQQGLASAGSFSINNAGNNANTISSWTSGTGYAVSGTSGGTNGAASFSINNSASSSAVVQINNAGTGYGISSNAPIQASKFIGDGSLLTGIVGGGLTLPYMDTSIDDNVAFQITKTGNSFAARLMIDNPTSSYPVLDVATNGNGIAGTFTKTGGTAGAALYGINSGLGASGMFYIDNAANNNNALLAETNGTGAAARIAITNTASTSPALLVINNGTGGAIYGNGNIGTIGEIFATQFEAGNNAGTFTINNASSNSTSLATGTNGVGRGFQVSMQNAASTADAINITHAGTGNAITANRPIQATQFIGDGSLLTNLPSSGLTLPFSSAATTPAVAFAVTNSGTGPTGLFQVVNTTSNGVALVTASNGVGVVLNVNASNASSTNAAVNITHSGTGAAINANSSINANLNSAAGGTAGSFAINNSANNSSALTTTTTGSGSAFVASNLGIGITASAATFSTFAATATAHAVRISATGSGNGLNLTHAGTGAGVTIGLTNATNPNFGLQVTHAGEGAGMAIIQNKPTGFGNALSATAVGNGSAIYVQQANNGRAIEVGSGGMRYNVTDVIATGAIATRSITYNIAIPGSFTFGWTPLGGDAVYVFNSNASPVTVAGLTVNPNTLAHMIYIQGGWRINQ